MPDTKRSRSSFTSFRWLLLGSFIGWGLILLVVHQCYG